MVGCKVAVKRYFRPASNFFIGLAGRLSYRVFDHPSTSYGAIRIRRAYRRKPIRDEIPDSPVSKRDNCRHNNPQIKTRVYD